MKSICCLAILTFFFLNIYAQDSLSTSYKYNQEFGLDASFINALLPLDNNIGFAAPYLFSYRIYRPDKKILRMGLDIDLEGVFDKPENEVLRNTQRIDLDYKVGWGKQREIFRNTVMFSGFDLLFDVFYANTKVGESSEGANDGNNKNTYQMDTGIGPFIGIQYNFTERIGIYTEAAFYLKIAYEIENTKFDNNARGEDASDRKLTYFESFRLPRFLILFYKF